MEDATVKKARYSQGEEPGASKSDGTTRSDENTRTPIDVLHYDELSEIFQYLSAKDLTSAGLTCSRWLEITNDEKRRRIEPCFFVLLPRRWSKSELELLNTNNINMRVTNYQDRETLKDEFFKYVNNIRIEPSVALCFTNPYSFRTDFIEDVLPSECKILINCGHFLLNMVPNIVHRLSDPYIICILFPKIPNVEFYFGVSHIIKEKKNNIYKHVNYMLFEHKPSASNQETCIMLFSDDSVAREINLRWGSAIQESTINKIDSLWGGVPPAAMERYGPFISQAVEITGSIKTWSIILKIEVDTTMEEVQTKLQSFKDKVKLKKHSIGFINLPGAAFDNSFEEKFKYFRLVNKIEAAVRMLCRSLFFHILLITFCSDLQYGKNTVEALNEEKNDENNAKRNQSKFWCHEESVVLTILSYG